MHSTDHPRALQRYKRILGVDPVHEFHIPGRDLVVTSFAGLSILSGPVEAVAGVRELRATVFVKSLKETEEVLLETGWTREGTLGSSGSLLARDPDGNLLEFVEQPSDEHARP